MSRHPLHLYSGWNTALVDHVFGRGTDPVTRIPATPDELLVVEALDQAESTEETRAGALNRYIAAVRIELSREGMGYQGYCTAYRGRRSDWWGPRRNEYPYFFAMLWLSCLVAYGYPDEDEGQFRVRLGNAIGTGPVNLGNEFDEVWEDLAAWTRCAAANGLRVLELPPPSRGRRIIGRPHFLAFPHRFDRSRLQFILADRGLVGVEPPVRLALEALTDHRNQFSEEFQADLSEFETDYLQGQRDLRESPFWRAVRQEALFAPVPPNGTEAPPRGRGALLARWDEDGSLVPFLGVPEDWLPGAPGPWQIEPLELPIGEAKRGARPSNGRIEDIFRDPRDYLRSPEASAVCQGVVPMYEEVSGLYRAAIAQEIAECDVAFVREDLAESVRTAFGGRDEPSAIGSPWVLFTGVRLRQLDQVPGPLAALTALMPTTSAPRPTVIGGIRAQGTSTFYCIDGYLPTVRARGATDVVVRLAEHELACEAVAGGDEWRLPDDLMILLADQQGIDSPYCEVRASYRDEVLGHVIARSGVSGFYLRRVNLGTSYKGVPTGDYDYETCAREGASIKGPAPEVTVGFTSKHPEDALDMLPFEVTARWLGPGLGEVSLDCSARLPWLAVGPCRPPNLLVLLVDAPTASLEPDGSRCTQDGARRHWRQAFLHSRRILMKRKGKYLDLPDWATGLLKRYRAAATAKPVGNRPIPPVPAQDLAMLDRDPDPPGDDDAAELSALRTALCAVAENRAGIPLREVHDIVAITLGLTEQHVVREHVVRALAESGAIDTLRRADGRQTVALVRRPRFVAYRSGPSEWKATVIGLAPACLLEELRRFSEEHGLACSIQTASCGLVPSVLRMGVRDAEALETARLAVGLGPTEFVAWENPEVLPPHLTPSGTIRTSMVPNMYEPEASWCWVQLGFRREPEQAGEVRIERRRDGRRTPLYVVSDERGGSAWSYSRTAALLTGHERAGRGFLFEERPGSLVVAGTSPLHLPLPWGRLCAVLGAGLPGPRISRNAIQPTVTGYEYPVGRRLGRMLVPHIPKAWLIANVT